MPAHSTVFVLADIAQLFAASDVVVLGQVASIDAVETSAGARTNVSVNVERSLKADAGASLILVETGGSIGEHQRWVFGAPTYFVGERVLVFAHQAADGWFSTTFLSMGKFRVVRAASGREFAVRNLLDGATVDPSNGRVVGSHVTRYGLAELLRQLGEQPAARQPRAKLVSRAARGGRLQPRFTFTGPPAVRWFLSEPGEPVRFNIDPSGDRGLGAELSLAAAHQALLAWSEVPCSTLKLAGADDGVQAPFGSCDGRSQIVFNDPATEVTDPVDCFGILAVGGVCANTAGPQPWGGGQYYAITEGDVVVNNGYSGCPFWTANNLAEVLTHEVGHTFGLAHSSDDPEEPDQLLHDATMYYQAHFDGRGAQLRADDRAAICSLYPSDNTGRLDLHHLALVYDAQQRPFHDRLVLGGELQLYDEQTTPSDSAVTIDLRVSGDSFLRAAIRPQDWRMNQDETRYRFRNRSGNTATIVQLTARGRGLYDVELRASGLDLSMARNAPVTLSISIGNDNVTKGIPLSNGSRARLFP